MQLTLSWDKAFQVSTIRLLKANFLMSSLVRFLNNLHECPLLPPLSNSKFFIYFVHSAYNPKSLQEITSNSPPSLNGSNPTLSTSHQPIARRSGVELATFWSQVQRPNHYATDQHELWIARWDVINYWIAAVTDPCLMRWVGTGSCYKFRGGHSVQGI